MLCNNGSFVSEKKIFVFLKEKIESLPQTQIC